MKRDKNGTSTCQAGEESYETFSVGESVFYQYDYGTQEEILFSCVGKSLEECRKKKERWIEFKIILP